MKIQAEISIYPLKTKSLSGPIDEFCRILKNKGVKVETGIMSSFVVGESEIVFASVQEAFEKVAEKYDIAMDMKVSNACPNRAEKEKL